MTPIENGGKENLFVLLFLPPFRDNTEMFQVMDQLVSSYSLFTFMIKKILLVNHTKKAVCAFAFVRAVSAVC